MGLVVIVLAVPVQDPRRGPENARKADFSGQDLDAVEYQLLMVTGEVRPRAAEAYTW
jgi:hypothetical protein